MEQPRRKPGPAPKGHRDPFTVRVPTEHKPIYEQQARNAGLPLGDYVALVLAHAHQLPEPAYITASPGQEALAIA